MAAMTPQERGALTHPDVTRLDDVNRDVLKMLTVPGKGWWALFAIAASGLGLFFGAWGWQIYKGIGVSGLNGPVGWACTSRPSSSGSVSRTPAR